MKKRSEKNDKVEIIAYERMPVAVSGVRRMPLIPPYAMNISQHVKAYEHIPFKNVDDKFIIKGNKIIIIREKNK